MIKHTIRNYSKPALEFYLAFNHDGEVEMRGFDGEVSWKFAVVRNNGVLELSADLPEELPGVTIEKGYIKVAHE